MGVLIALAVDNWWEERLERAAESQYLQSLQIDFETNREQLTVRIAEESMLIEHGKRLHELIESDSAESGLDEIYRFASDLYTLKSWMPTSGTYDEMLGSGRLTYIQNAELRKKLSQYAHLLQRVRTIEDYSWMSWLNEQSPFLRKHLNVSQFGWIGDYYRSPPFDVDIQRLRSREFHNLVSTWMVARQDIVIVYRRVIRAGDEILEVIASELADR